MRAFGLLFIVLGGCHHPPGVCSDEWPAQFSRELDGRAYDVAVVPGGYVLALSSGVVELEPCGFAPRAACADSLEARRLSLRPDGRVVDYLRRDGTVAACDLSTSSQVDPAPAAAEELHGPRRVEQNGAAAWIASGRVWLKPAAEVARALTLPAEALDARFSADGATLAVSDRRGGVSLFSARTGASLARRAAHPRNAYGVAFDDVNHRVLSVAGPGQLTITTF